VSSDEQESPEAICERLVWSHNPDGLVNAPDASTTSWAGSVQQEVRMFGNRPEAGWPAAKADPYPAMALIMMVKDEGDVISENIRWHYFVGVRKFLILDNSSNDETARNLKSLSKTLTGVEFLILNDPTISYLQAQKTTGLFRLAISIWPEVRWVIPTDADEFLIPQRGFQSLELVPEHVDAVTVPKSIHFQNRIQTYTSS
jgi:Glycosyl transferase family 2